jgi:hypothetical protein
MFSFIIDIFLDLLQFDSEIDAAVGETIQRIQNIQRNCEKLKTTLELKEMQIITEKCNILFFETALLNLDSEAAWFFCLSSATDRDALIAAVAWKQNIDMLSRNVKLAAFNWMVADTAYSKMQLCLDQVVAQKEACKRDIQLWLDAFQLHHARQPVCADDVLCT